MMRKSDGGRERVEFWGVNERGVDEERELLVVVSFIDGRRGVLRQAENQPRMGVGVDGVVGGRTGREIWDGRERKEVMVATRSEAAAVVVGWSERGLSVETAAWPKINPWTSPAAEEARWRRDARAAPVIWIWSIGKSSMPMVIF